MLHCPVSRSPHDSKAGKKSKPPEEAAFLLEKTRPPSDGDLGQTIGRAKRHWDALLAVISRDHPDVLMGWKHYAGKTGWRFIVHRKGRNLAYLKPCDGRFTVSLALSDQALDAAERSGVPAQIIDPIRASPKYPEGRAARVDVVCAKDVALAFALLAIKAAT